MIIFNNTDLNRSRAEILITVYLIRSNLKENIVSINGTHNELLRIDNRAYQIRERASE